MRILLLSNSPVATVAYGVQTGLLARQLQANGHDVAIQTFAGHRSTTLDWHGIPVYPSSDTHRNHLFGLDLTSHFMAEHKADLLLTLTDAWCFNPMLLVKYHVAHWMPIDSAALGDPDISTLRASGAIPIAMSRHGETLLNQAGYAALYAPHGIDTDLYCPPEDRDAHRRSVGIDDDEFIVISANANMDLYRKAWPVNMAGFARFHARHPKSRLLCHTPDDGRPTGLNLGRWAKRLGIFDAVEFCDPERYRTGDYTQEYLARVFYPVGDCYLGATRAEGFGVTLVEAAACGVPTIATNFGPMRETAAAGILVEGEPFESPLHTDWWVTPSMEGIDQALEFYWQMREQGELPKLRARARAHARHYDHRLVYKRDWVSVLDEIERRIDGPTLAEKAEAHDTARTEFLAKAEARNRLLDAGQDAGDAILGEREAWAAYRDTMPTRRYADPADVVAGPDQSTPTTDGGLP